MHIHTDGSPDAENEADLLTAAEGLDARIVRPSDRKPVIAERLAHYPKIRSLTDGMGYFAKPELPMAAERLYFYFDSDIVWLRPVANLVTQDAPERFLHRELVMV